jgi:hypothetical protein
VVTGGVLYGLKNAYLAFRLVETFAMVLCESIGRNAGNVRKELNGL